VTKQRKCKIVIQDEVNCFITNLKDDHILYFYEEYGMFAANHFFNPKFKLGSWDGKIRFFHKTGKTHVNLLDDIIPRLIGLRYDIEIDDRREGEAVFPEPITERFFADRGVKDPETGEDWIMRNYQVGMTNALIDNAGGIGICGTGGGKMQSLNSLILTTDGWVRMGDITTNHVVICPDGTVADITGIFPQASKEAYRVTFHDGSSTVAGKEHLWKVKRPEFTYRANTISDVVDTQYMADFLELKASGQHVPGNISIPLVQPVESLGPEERLPLDPYLLGVLIGDGCLRQATPMISTADVEVLDNIQPALQALKLKTKFSGYGCDYRIVKDQQAQNNNKNPLVNILEDLGVHGTLSYQKAIPSKYINSTVEQRFELIRGLFDSDGTVGTNGSVSYSTTSLILATQVQQIIWSLGGTCNIRTRENARLAYDCIVGFPDTRMLFKLTRKLERCGIHANGRVELMRRVKSVVRIEDEPMQCIMIDHPDHLYITDDYIVTHNTSMTAALALVYGEFNMKSIIIVPDKNLTDQTVEEYIFFGVDVGQYSGEVKDLNHTHIVSTWQALQNNPTIIQDFDMIIVDECHGLKGQILTKLLNEYGKNISYRFGVTGTLPKAETDAMAVRIAVGSVQYTKPAHELIDEDYLASLHIEVLQLEANFKEDYEEYKSNTIGKPVTYRKFKDEYFPDYTSEKQYNQSDDARLKYIARHIEKKRDEGKGNVLCLVDGVRFGKKLTGYVEGAMFLSGADKMKARKEVYELFKENDNLVVIATVQIASTGLNIKRIYNMMFIDVGKSFIRVIQTIGRGLRKAPDKDHVDVTDICSDLKYGRKHMAERVKFYKEAKYPHTKKSVDYSTPDVL
jgi:superfamily II DNA or RNA helicase